MASKTGLYKYYAEGNTMSGPHKLTTQNAAQIDDKAVGVYVLSRLSTDMRPLVVYVGRGNLRDRLSKHAAAADGDSFYFKVLNSDEQAFQEECRMYRHYGKEQYLDNEIAPALPAGSKLPPCT